MDAITNPQVAYGEDVIGRITYATTRPDGLEVLNTTINRGIGELIANTTRKAGLTPESISEVVIVGNTAMHHLFLNLNPRYLAQQPYVPTISQAIKHFTQPRGEFTLVIEGSRNKEKPRLTEDIEGQLHYMYLSGITAKEAIAKVAGETGLSRKELYQAWLRLDKTWNKKEIMSKF